MPPPSNTATKSSAAPERSLTQRLDALERANEVRTKRAQLKRDLKGGRCSQCRISPSKTIGGLAQRQRDELVSLLRR